MSQRMALLIAYTIVFTTFNFIISLFYNIYGWVVFRRKYVKLSHAPVSKAQKKYLVEIDFVNVHRNWLKEYYIKIRNYSIIYFFVMEILCFAAIYFTGRYVLVCRISLALAIFLFLLWFFLLFNFRKKNKKLAKQHLENLKNVLKDFEDPEYEDSEYDESDE